VNLRPLPNATDGPDQRFDATQFFVIAADSADGYRHGEMKGRRKPRFRPLSETIDPTVMEQGDHGGVVVQRELCPRQ
jgi:hypothetical protein